MLQRPDFQRLKTAISVEAFLTAGGWQPTGCRAPALLAGPCPIHGGDNPRAFVLWRHHNRWRCFTRCQRGGDILDLAAALWRCSLREAAVRLMTQEPVPAVSEPSTPPHVSRSSPFRPFQRWLPLNPDVPFLRSKGIAPDTARAFDVGLYSGSGWLRGCVGVRLFDPVGRPLGYAGRRLCPLPNQSKWRFPPGLPARELLYNYHRVRAADARTCVLVECPWSVLRLHQVGLPAVALMGLGLSERQRQLLLRFERILLLLDGDPAGREAAARLSRRLSSDLDVRIHTLPTGRDPDDLPPEALAGLRPYLDIAPIEHPTARPITPLTANRPHATRSSPSDRGAKDVEATIEPSIASTTSRIGTHHPQTQAEIDPATSARTL